MKVSFDFDNTLSKESVQKYAANLIAIGIEVHIVTSRYEFYYCNNNDLYEVADRLGIKRENIHFTNMRNKCDFFQENPDFIFHLDDDSIEIDFINKLNITKGISCLGSNWISKCDKLINKNRL